MWQHHRRTSYPVIISGEPACPNMQSIFFFFFAKEFSRGGGSKRSGSATLTGYISPGDCKGESFTWPKVTDGCISYVANGQAQKMYSVFVDPLGNLCGLYYYSDAVCSPSTQLAITPVGFSTPGCQNQAAATGFMSFAFACSIPR